MSNSIVPVADLHKTGVVKDSPSISLAPNAFDDVANVRFHASHVSKMQGEIDLVTAAELTAGGVGDILHVLWWENPNLAPDNGYYIVVSTDGTIDKLHIVDANTKTCHDLDYDVPTGGDWQHTLFQGGYAVILNNGKVKPCYILDETGNTDITTMEAFELPGWDSYYTVEESVNDVYNPNTHIPDFDIGQRLDFTSQDIVVNVLDATTKAIKFSNTHSSAGTVKQSTVFLDEATDSHVVSIALTPGGAGANAFTEVLQEGDNVVILIKSREVVQTRASVIRTWGDTLVAANITELTLPSVTTVNTTNSQITFSSTHSFTTGDKIYLSTPYKQTLTLTVVDSTTVSTVPALDAGASYTNVKYSIASSVSAVRNQTGVVRISDVAAPGSIPHNWNPYSAGVSTAEEFQLSSTGVITELSEMQGRLYVYSDTSIHSITRTGNTTVPYVSNVVSTSYGALARNCVLEFNGVHIVIGSNDIYQFSGHPSSIQSLAQGRLQDYLFDNINNKNSINIIQNRAFNEVWIGYSKVDANLIDEVLVWNYLNNAWTIRKLTPTVNMVCGKSKSYDVETSQLSSTINSSTLRPIMATRDEIFGADFKDVYTRRDGSNYESYISRSSTPLSPEYDVEYLSSVALWVDKDDSGNIDLDFRFRTTNYPGENVSPALTTSGSVKGNSTFTIGEDYKADVRINGRFLHWMITDTGATDKNWKLVGMQLAMGKGGRR